MKKIMHIAWEEVKKIFGDRMGRATLLVVAMVPLLYGGLYLWAFWDPYAHMQDLPIAVVNEDSGATFEGATVNYGNDLVSTLKSNQVLKWSFISENEAKSGLKDRKYYIEVKVPNNFSSNIVSANSDTPTQAGIEFTAREATNLLAAQVTNRYISEIVNRVNVQVGEAYYKSIFEKSHQSALKVQEAATGAGTLSNGIGQLHAGSEALSEGIGSAKNGSQAIADNLIVASAGADKLSGGITVINDGYNKLFSGLQVAGQSLDALNTGSKTVSTGLTTLNSSLSQLTDGTNQAKKGLADSTNAVSQAILVLQKYSAANSSTSTDLDFQTALALLNGGNNGLKSVNSSMTSISSGMGAASTGTQSLLAGQLKVSGGISQIAEKMTEAIQGGTALQSGLNTAKEGSISLNSGLKQLSTGAGDLNNGLLQIQNGNAKISDSLQQAKNGSAVLASSLQAGASEALLQTDPDSTNKKLAVLSNPIALKDTSIQKVANYGTGFAPYFIPLALWVGALLMFFVVGVDDVKIASEESSSRQLVLGKYSVLAGIGVIQALLTGLLLQFSLGLQVAHVGLFYLFLVLMSWSFIAILKFLVALAGDAGKFIGIVLLMLQLTSCAGTFPIETIPNFFQKISPWLPMTYGTLGLREIISGDNMHVIFSTSMVLIGVIVVFLFLLIAAVKFIRNRKSAII